MAKLYYGNGNCSIEGSEIRGVEIRYRGAIQIDSKAGDKFAIANQNNGIIIFPIGEGFLTDLFDYTGEFKIISVIVADNNSEKVPTTIHRVMDYTELLTTNSEDMTTKSEDLSSTYVSGKRISKTLLKQQNIENLHTSDWDLNLYYLGGEEYRGNFYIDLKTGACYTPSNVLLYYKKVGSEKRWTTLNKSKIPPATIDLNRKNKLRKNKRRIAKRAGRKY